MFLKENKLFVCLFVCLFVSSCSNKTKSDEYVKNTFNTYSATYKIITDSVKMYSDSLLKEYLHIYNQEWEIDSLLCINSTNDKLVTTINNSTGKGKYGVSDEITKILGKKINNQWYFFEGGGTLVVPRELYGKDEMHPLSMHELSQIARKEFLQGALIKNEKGEYVVSDKWVNKHFENVGICFDCKTRQEFDSVHWHIILDKWNDKFDTSVFKKQTQNFP